MTKDGSEKKTEKDLLKNLEQENQNLKNQLALMMDREGLQNKSIYRQQRLIMEERKILALERQAVAMENLVEESKVSEIPSKKENEEE